MLVRVETPHSGEDFLMLGVWQASRQSDLSVSGLQNTRADAKVDML